MVLLCADAMERATSEPPKITAGLGNPFYSDRAHRNIALKASRPKGLPEQSPESDVAPLHGGRMQELALEKAVGGNHPWEAVGSL